MTQFVRSILGKRNPRNVPLDIFDLGGDDPYPYPFEDPSLSPEEKTRRWEAIKRHSQSVDASHEPRRAAAREKYTEILAEVVRGIGETTGRLLSSGILQGGLDAKSWIRLGRDLESLFRDAAAAVFVVYLLKYDLFYPKRTTEIRVGKKTASKVTGAELRNAFEERVALIGRWVVARAAFESRPEISAARALRSAEALGRAHAAIQAAQAAAIKAQAGIAGGDIDPFARNSPKVFGDIVQMYYEIAGALVILRDRSLQDAAEALLENPMRSLEASVKKAERLAVKGEPGPSRKLAREAAIREGDELKQNPFVRSILRYA